MPISAFACEDAKQVPICYSTQACSCYAADKAIYTELMGVAA